MSVLWEGVKFGEVCERKKKIPWIGRKAMPGGGGLQKAKSGKLQKPEPKPGS